MIFIGSDHAGFDLKNSLIAYFIQKGFEYKDLGAFSAESVDYPDFAHPVASATETQPGSLGVLICGSANGVAITANKHHGIRAAICWNLEIAILARKHNDANILCLPARFLSMQEGVEIFDFFLSTPFEGGRHATRVGKIPL